MGNPGELLDPRKILANVRDLHERVRDRFDGHAIAERADRLVKLAERATTRPRELARPRYIVRGLCLANAGLLIAAAIVAVGFAIRAFLPEGRHDLLDVVQGIESGISCIVFLGIALVFFWSLERRLRRNELLREMDYLRNFLHLVNMGQLDKEPARLEMGFERTKASPEMRLDANHMERYLSHSQKLVYYAAEIGCVYANALVDAEVDHTADQLREFASDIAKAAGDKITILTLKTLGQHPAVTQSPMPMSLAEQAGTGTDCG